VFDGAAEPVLCFNAEQNKWLMYYAAHRATAPNLGNAEWVYGSDIGIAESTDGGATWKYIGKAEIDYGKEEHPKDYTYWTPEVIWRDGLYYMYLCYAPGTFNDWNHPREIVYLSSKDGIKWDTISPIDLKSDRVLDPCVMQMPGGQWRMWYKDETRKNAICCADSTDPAVWDPRGTVLGDFNGSGPKVFHWKGRYWLIADGGRHGMRVWASDNAQDWYPQDPVLCGSHGDAVVSRGRAWWFYTAPTGKRTSCIKVTELFVVDGNLTIDPTKPTYIDLKPAREEER
jgi:hypothetical protein